MKDKKTYSLFDDRFCSRAAASNEKITTRLASSKYEGFFPVETAIKKKLTKMVENGGKWLMIAKNG